MSSIANRTYFRMSGRYFRKPYLLPYGLAILGLLVIALPVVLFRLFAPEVALNSDGIAERIIAMKDEILESLTENLRYLSPRYLKDFYIFRQLYDINWPVNRCIPYAIEIIIFLTCVWKLFFRKEIKAFFRIRTLLMIICSYAFLYEILYGFFEVQTIPFYNTIIEYLDMTGCSFVLVFIFAFDSESYLRFLIISVIYLISYITTKAIFRDAERQMVRENAVHVPDYETSRMFGFFTIESNAKKHAGRFQPSPRIYLTNTMPKNGVNLGNVIIIDISNADMDSSVGGIARMEGTLAHEFGHCYEKDTTANMICAIALNAMCLPLELILCFMRLLTVFTSIVPFGGIPTGILYVATTLLFRLMSGIANFVIFKVFGLFSGKAEERRADRFAVDIGYGPGLYAALDDHDGYYSRLDRFIMLFDVHPSPKKRCSLIRRRIIQRFGIEAWNDFQKEYMLSDGYTQDVLKLGTFA